ncbi:hypothetical protein TNCV_3223871 [Trichonephila clavipes]|nr:hypothetical protein TNCV_3223871 [Trichonephila clavipes]
MFNKSVAQWLLRTFGPPAMSGMGPPTHKLDFTKSKYLAEVRLCPPPPPRDVEVVGLNVTPLRSSFIISAEVKFQQSPQPFYRCGPLNV